MITFTFILFNNTFVYYLHIFFPLNLYEPFITGHRAAIIPTQITLQALQLCEMQRLQKLMRQKSDAFSHMRMLT